jgi:hypothetical protein
MEFPYGIADFHTLRKEGYFYVDRTDRIAAAEAFGRQLLLLRPRRFGKSLWLSTLENYYALDRADQFDALFGKLAIGQNSTPLHNPRLWPFRRWKRVDPARPPNPQGSIREVGVDPLSS